jgi:hypothetical protein
MAELEDARDRLLSALNRETNRLETYDDYFEGEQPLKFIAPLVEQRSVDRSLIELWFEIPRFAVEVYENRLDIEGFRYAGSDSSDDELWSCGRRTTATCSRSRPTRSAGPCPLVRDRRCGDKSDDCR